MSKTEDKPGLGKEQFETISSKLDKIIGKLEDWDGKQLVPAGDAPKKRQLKILDPTEQQQQHHTPTPPSSAPKRAGVSIVAGESPTSEATPPPQRRGVRIAGEDSSSPTSHPSTSAAEATAAHQQHTDPIRQKKDQAEAKKKRKEFFDPLVHSGDWTDIPQTTGVKCVWLGCAALAIEFITGKKVTMEDILRNNRLALHYVSFPSVTLPELADIVDEYLSTAEKVRDTHSRCEVATFDTTTMEDGGDELGTGDRLPITSLSAFRKELSTTQGSDHSLHIFNYDPFVVQESEIKHHFGEEDDDEEDENEKSVKSPKMKQWARKNMGQFAVLIGYNQALHTVTLATPYLGPDGKTHLETHQCSVQTLYSSCVAKDGYSKRSRGFIRVFTDLHHEEGRGVPMAFPLSLLDGTASNGMLSIALDIAIAPHLLGLSLVQHVIRCTLLDEAERRRLSGTRASKAVLRGIPVTEICTVLKLPVHVIVGGSRKDSLKVAYSWMSTFLKNKALDSKIHIGLSPISRRNDAEDGLPSMMDEEFMQHMVESLHSKCVVLLNFDINVAQNVMIATGSDTDPSHFALVVGVDEHRGIVRLADVSVKKFRKTWHVPITRLYNATIGYGFMVFSNKKEVAARHHIPAAAEGVTSMARYALPPSTAPVRFEFPKKNYSVTLIADALCELGFKTCVEDIVYNSGFHISFLLSEHIPMFDVCRIVEYYSHTILSDEASCNLYSTDCVKTGTKELFIKAIDETLAKGSTDQQLIVGYSVPFIQSKSAVWNGSNGGPIARVLSKDAATNTVTLQDTNPEVYYRVWTCPIDILYDAMKQEDRISQRARGWMILNKEKQLIYEDTCGVDPRNAMVHHPFKTPISSPASAMALAISHLTQEHFSGEQIIYSNPEFALISLTSGSDFAKIKLMAITAVQSLNLSDSLSVSEHAYTTLAEIQKVLEGNEVVVAILDRSHISTMVSAKGAGGVVVNRVSLENKSLQICDGNPTRYGGVQEVPEEEFKKSIIGMMIFKKL